MIAVICVLTALINLQAHSATVVLTSRHGQKDGNFGYSVSGIPDVNGDARGDVVVGAPFEDVVSVVAGRAYVFDGANGIWLRTLRSPGNEPFGLFGASVAGIPDANANGQGNVIVGAPEEDPDSSPERAGRAYIFDGTSGLLIYTLVSPNEISVGRFGSCVSGVPDVNGDGRGDVVVGADSEEVETFQSVGLAGRAYIFDGVTGNLLHTLVSPNASF
ncbi:MAG: FG-GAP repeat protein, partial [Candidatus Omnitrophica bacterium]|nr:FG-GAP repeat protein [Candidatus Omnitrophota bacterium]